MRSSLAGLLAAATLSATGAAAQETSWGGSLAGELRGFPNPPLADEQLGPLQLSFTFAPDVLMQSESGRHRFSLVPFLRLDAQDSERTHFDLREAHWRGVFGDWEVVAGVDQMFWGVTESRHLVDVVNQIDVLEDIDEEDKRGQPMLSVEWQRLWGRVTALALFGFRERSYPGLQGRLRLPLPVDTDGVVYTDGERPVDFALRYAHFLGGFDLGVSAFHGIGREPAFRLNDAGELLIPVYSQVTQAGMDLQYTRGAWLWKLEAILRSGPGDAFGAAVAGLEHTHYQILGSGADLGLLFEYLYDGRDADAPPTPFDHAVFGGARLALGDVSDTNLLAGVIVDLDDGSIGGRVEAERRVNDNLTLELEARISTNVSAESVLYSLRRDSFAALRLEWHF